MLFLLLQFFKQYKREESFSRIKNKQTFDHSKYQNLVRIKMNPFLILGIYKMTNSVFLRGMPIVVNNVFYGMNDSQASQIYM